jgi:hypothetical protein
VRQFPAKALLDDVLDLNSRWFSWIDTITAFEKALKSKIPWEQLDDHSRKGVEAHLRTGIPSMQPLINSMYLTMVSGFEEYLRDTIKEATKFYSSSRQKYDDLDPAVRKTHVRESARLLLRIDSPPDHFQVDMDDLCRGLGSCTPGSNNVLLNSDAFADVDSLIVLETFGERLGAFGINVSLDVLGKSRGVRAALRTSMQAGARETAKTLGKELSIMRRYRNKIAHAGGSASEVSMDVLGTHRELIKAVGEAINDVVIQWQQRDARRR